MSMADYYDYDPTAGREVLPDDEPPGDDDPRVELAAELRGLAWDLDGGEEQSYNAGPWPPTEIWTRRLRAVLAEVEGARRSARGDDPPDSGQSLGLETRGGAR